MNSDNLLNCLLYCDFKTIRTCFKTRDLDTTYLRDYLWKLLCERDYGLSNKIDDITFYKKYKVYGELSFFCENTCYNLECLLDCKDFNSCEYILFSLPSCIGYLINLVSLDLRGSEFDCLPTECGKLTNLRIMDLSDNYFQNIPTEIGQLIQLTELYLENNFLMSLPQELGYLTKLRNLNVSQNHLVNIPDEITKLYNLEALELGNNKLMSVSCNMAKLTNLKKLNLDTSLLFIPSELALLPKLQELDLCEMIYCNAPPSEGSFRSALSRSYAPNEVSPPKGGALQCS